MKTLFKRNIFISLMSLGLLSSVTAHTPKPVTVLVEEIKGMILDETKMLEDAVDLLKENGHHEIASLLMHFSDKLFEEAKNLNIDLTSKLSLENSIRLAELLKPLKIAPAYVLKTYGASKVLSIAGQVFKISPIFSTLKDTQQESDWVLHLALIRRKDKIQIKTTEIVHVNESFDFTTGSAIQDDLVEHHVNVHGDLTVEHTATIAVKAADKKTNS